MWKNCQPHKLMWMLGTLLVYVVPRLGGANINEIVLWCKSGIRQPFDVQGCEWCSHSGKY